jgi:hypothetical protein
MPFFRNDLQRTRLQQGKCPIKNCPVKIQQHRTPFRRYKGKMIYLPFCPEHGIRVHSNTFVYYNGPSKEDLLTSTKRNLIFNAEYYVANFLDKSSKVESSRLCYESSEDAVTYNVFTELFAKHEPLRKLVRHIAKTEITQSVELYLWGGKIDVRNNSFSDYKPLQKVRKHLEHDIRSFVTEPDIILIVPKKILICIEAKFGSKNPIAKEKEEKTGEKPKSTAKLIKRYCSRNAIIDTNNIFDFQNRPGRFYEQLFRNIVFAASMAKLAGIENWYVVNLRSQHVMDLKKGKPESMPVVRNIRSILRPKYKKRFVHLTWEDIYYKSVKDNPNLSNLSWYMKNKTLSCRRAFNIF